MEMSPQRVRNAEFQTVRKGADPDEVKLFLNDVADELERAQNQSTAMEARARAAVARLQEVSESSAAAAATGASTTAAPVTVDASVDEAETISRTLLLAQRTADTTVAEARSEAGRIVGAANDEAATTLDSTREMAARLLDEARVEARRVGESERLAISGEVESLKARRDFLEADVEQLELFLAEQRSRLRDAATSMIEITERVPGGLGEVRRPLMSASDDESTAQVDDDLIIVTELAADDAIEDTIDDGEDNSIDDAADDEFAGEFTGEFTDGSTEDRSPDASDGSRFSFDDEPR